MDGAARGAAEATDIAGRFDALYSIEWSRSPLDVTGMIAAARRLRELVRRNRYDIVHVHTPIAAFVTRAALGWRRHGSGPSVIYTAHGFHFMPGRKRHVNLLFQSAEKIAGLWTDYLVTINRTDEAAARRLRLVPPARVRYMPGIGIDPEHYAPSDVASDEPVFLMIAEFTANKRHCDVIAALARMQNRSGRLMLLGEGPTEAAIRAQVQAAGLSDRVEFAGLQRDVRPWIQKARALVLPSFREGLPRSVMEALSSGVPVIGSQIRGISDLLANGGGKLFPPGDVDSLTAHLDWFAEHPAEARHMGETGRASIAKYDVKNVIALHEELYRSAMQ